jgi:hypothetical protein
MHLEPSPSRPAKGIFITAMRPTPLEKMSCSSMRKTRLLLSALVACDHDGGAGNAGLADACSDPPGLCRCASQPGKGTAPLMDDACRALGASGAAGAARTASGASSAGSSSAGADATILLTNEALSNGHCCCSGGKPLNECNYSAAGSTGSGPSYTALDLCEGPLRESLEDLAGA